MAWQKLKFHLTSDAPLLMHSGQLADPLNRFAKQMKQITSKSKKTDADFEELARIEFLGGIYANENGPAIPGDNVEAMLVAAAKTEKGGKKCKSGVYCSTSFDLEYEGPRDGASLWADDKFRSVRAVRVGQSRVMRCRPIFHDWSATVEVNYEDGLVNKTDVVRWMKISGAMIGMLDDRPKYGRFTAKLIE